MRCVLLRDFLPHKAGWYLTTIRNVNHLVTCICLKGLRGEHCSLIERKCPLIHVSRSSQALHLEYCYYYETEAIFVLVLNFQPLNYYNLHIFGGFFLKNSFSPTYRNICSEIQILKHLFLSKSTPKSTSARLVIKISLQASVLDEYKWVPVMIHKQL